MVSAGNDGQAVDLVPLDDERGAVVVNRERGRIDLTIGGVAVTSVASTPVELSDLIAALSAGGRWLWGEDWQQQADEAGGGS